jgi:predicted small metal-binding protein
LEVNDMKRLACRDMGMNCNYEVSGESDDEIMRRATEHGQKAHNMTFSKDDEQKIRKQIKNV